MKEFYSGPELAELLGYTRARIWQLTRAGVIDGFRGPRGALIYTRVEVERLLRDGLPNARGVRNSGGDD